MTEEKMKRCNKCKRTLPESEFAKDISKGDGLQSMCKECHRRAGALWYPQRVKDMVAVRKQAIAEQKTKLCAGCGQWLPITYFYRRATGKYGVSGKCKACIQKENRERYRRQQEQKLRDSKNSD